MKRSDIASALRKSTNTNLLISPDSSKRKKKQAKALSVDSSPGGDANNLSSKYKM